MSKAVLVEIDANAIDDTHPVDLVIAALHDRKLISRRTDRSAGAFLRLSSSRISQWRMRTIPMDWIPYLAGVTGLPPHKLRPDAPWPAEIRNIETIERVPVEAAE